MKLLIAIICLFTIQINIIASYNCSKCSDCYPTERGLLQHDRLSHGNNGKLFHLKVEKSAARQDDGTFKCCSCGTLWLNKYSFAAHCKNVKCRNKNEISVKKVVHILPENDQELLDENSLSKSQNQGNIALGLSQSDDRQNKKAIISLLIK